MIVTRSKVVIVDCNSSKVPNIARVVEELDVESCLLRPHQLPGIASNPPAAVIISGNPALVCETGTGFLTDFKVLRTLNVPVLGICFGHQVIGLLYGAEVITGKEDRGQRQVELLQTDPLFNGLSAKIIFQQDHTEEVALPKDFLHLATSSHCFNESMKHPERPMWGVQFHPESSGSAGKQLIANFLSCTNKRWKSETLDSFST